MLFQFFLLVFTKQVLEGGDIHFPVESMSLEFQAAYTAFPGCVTLDSPPALCPARGGTVELDSPFPGPLTYGHLGHTWYKAWRQVIQAKEHCQPPITRQGKVSCSRGYPMAGLGMSQSKLTSSGPKARGTD